MLATIACVQLDDRGNNLKVILNKQMAPKVVTLHTIYDPYVSKNLKREPAIMAKLKHPIIVSLEGRGRLCRQLLLMPGRRICPLEATSAT